MTSTLRTIRRGEPKKLIPVTTGTTAATIPNYGVSVVTTGGFNYVLAAPEEGVVKTILADTLASSADAAPVVRTSVTPSSLGTVSVGVAGSTASEMTFGSSGASGQPSITLVGINSTRWGVIANNGVTFST